MFRSRGVAVVVLLAASSLLTLKLMGLSQWIQAILVIGVELSLGVVIHEMVDGPGRREARARRHRHRPGHHAGPPSHRRRPSHHPPAPGPPRTPARDEAASEAGRRLLLPVRDDRPGLVDYALRECRSHRAGLDLLFLRVLRGIPDGPSAAPWVGDDLEARTLIERARRRAERAGVPFRAFDAVTTDAAATILEQATAREADLVVMAAPGRGRGIFAARRPGRDDLGAVLDALPDHIGLLVHA